MTDNLAGAGRPAAVRGPSPDNNVASIVRRVDATIDKSGSITRLCLRGTLDTVSGASAYDTIVACAAAPTTHVLLDLNGLEAVTRAGSRAIHVAAKLLHRRGGRMIVFGIRPDVALVLKDTGFDNLIEFRDGMVPSVATASIVRDRDSGATSVWPSSKRRAS